MFSKSVSSFEPVGQLYEQYGEAVAESTGSPLAGEYFEEFVDPLFFLGGIGGIPKRAGRIADAATDGAQTAEALTEGLPAKPPEFSYTARATACYGCHARTATDYSFKA